MIEEIKPVEFSEIKSGMTLWDDKEKRVAKVLRVYLWESILEENPDRYYKSRPQKGLNHEIH